MSKLDSFKQRATARGQLLTISAFSSWPTGTYVNTWANQPDPDSPTYPSSPPEPVYGSGVSVYGFLQPSNGKTYVRAPWGEDVKVQFVAYVPGDHSLGLLDKIAYASTDYYVISLAEWREGATRIHWIARLVTKIRRS